MSDIFEKLNSVEIEAEDFGFAWSDYAQILRQIVNESEEIRDSVENHCSAEHLQEEIGDLLHAAFSLCLFFKLDPKEALDKAINKVKSRVDGLIYHAKKAGYDTLKGQPVEVLLKFWDMAKKDETLVK